MTISRNLMISISLVSIFALAPLSAMAEQQTNKKPAAKAQAVQPKGPTGAGHPAVGAGRPTGGPGQHGLAGPGHPAGRPGERLPAQDHTLPMTEATGAIANAGPGQPDIGVPTNVVLDGAVIGGLPTDTGTSTIIRWTGRRRSFQISNMPIPARRMLRRHRTQYPYRHPRQW